MRQTCRHSASGVYADRADLGCHHQLCFEQHAVYTLTFGRCNKGRPRAAAEIRKKKRITEEKGKKKKQILEVEKEKDEKEL